MSRDDEILVARRKAGSHLEHLWEFPGGKLEPDESPEDCLRREFREELGVGVRVGRILEAVFHRYPDRTVLLLFFACELVGGTPRAIDCEELAWVKRRELTHLAWVPADVPFVQKLVHS